MLQIDESMNVNTFSTRLYGHHSLDGLLSFWQGNFSILFFKKCKEMKK